MTFRMTLRMTLRMIFKTWDFRGIFKEDFEGDLGAQSSQESHVW